MNTGQLLQHAARRVPRRRESATTRSRACRSSPRSSSRRSWRRWHERERHGNGNGSALPTLTKAGLPVRPGDALVPGLRRLRDPRRGPGASCRSWASRPSGSSSCPGIGCAGPLRLLHGHLRDARHPRPRAGARDRARHRARRPLGLGRHRRRRRALDRRQPPDPRAAPQRADQDPALQQPDLRADQGPVLADEREGQGHQVDAVRLAGPPVQPGRAGARRRGDVRRAHGRHRQEAPRRRRCARPPSTRARRSSRSTRTATSSTTAPSTRVRDKGAGRAATRSGSSTASRSASAPRASAASSAAPTAASSSSTSPTSARTRSRPRRPPRTTRASRSRSPASRTRPTGPDADRRLPRRRAPGLRRRAGARARARRAPEVGAGRARRAAALGRHLDRLLARPTALRARADCAITARSTSSVVEAQRVETGHLMSGTPGGPDSACGLSGPAKARRAECGR